MLGIVDAGGAAHSGSGSAFGIRPRWRLSWGPGCLTPQVGAGDHAGQNAQPRLPPLTFGGGVLRGCSPCRLLSGAPGGTLRSVSFRFVSHIFSSRAGSWASVWNSGIGISTMLFTFHRFGSSASSPTPPESVNKETPPHNLPQGSALVRGRVGDRTCAGARRALRERPLL